MRLICPNCSAQYEIDVTLIPDEGRDVQCSNCGHTWFELPPPAQADGASNMPEDAPEPEPEIYDDPAPEEEDGDAFEPQEQSTASKAIAAATDDVSADAPGKSEPFKDVEDPFEAAASEFVPTSKPDAVIESPAADDDSDGHVDKPSESTDAFEDDEPADIDLSAIAPTTLKARRPSDAADVDLLREEAQRELSRRAAPPSEALESQTELGLEGLTNRKTPSRALRARMARSSGAENTFEDTQPTSDDDYQAPQRDLLPDIDEINSTLNQNDNAEATQASGRSGFRLGFGLTVLLCVAAIFAYIFAPNIAGAVPGAEPALLRFVDLANQLRDWIDGLLA
ncbi:MAG: zinc-ribbon domain-containing protein [Paracoccaceae bacterium]